MYSHIFDTYCDLAYSLEFFIQEIYTLVDIVYSLYY